MIDIDEMAKTDRARRWWLLNSGIPQRFLGRTLEDLKPYSPEVMDSVNRWLTAVEDGRILTRERLVETQGVGFSLIGDPGHGKTSLARALLHEVVLRVPHEHVKISNIPGRMPRRVVHSITYVELLEAIKKTFRVDVVNEDQIYIDRLFGRGDDPYQVLVVDDLGKEHKTSSKWAETTVDSLVRSRYDFGYATIITSNVAFEKWGSVYGAPMASFAHEALTPLMIVHPEGDQRL